MLVVLIVITLASGMEAVIFRDMDACVAAIPNAEELVRKSGAKIAAVQCVPMRAVEYGEPT